MTDKDKELQTMADVLVGKLRLKLTPKRSETDEYVDRLIRANRKATARMTESQRQAAVIRGCM